MYGPSHVRVAWQCNGEGITLKTLKVVRSTLAVPLSGNLRQVVHIKVPLASSSLVLVTRHCCPMAGKLTVGLAPLTGSRPEEWRWDECATYTPHGIWHSLPLLFVSHLYLSQEAKSRLCRFAAKPWMVQKWKVIQCTPRANFTHPSVFGAVCRLSSDVVWWSVKLFQHNASEWDKQMTELLLQYHALWSQWSACAIIIQVSLLSCHIHIVLKCKWTVCCIKNVTVTTVYHVTVTICQVLPWIFPIPIVTAMVITVLMNSL